MVEKYLPRLRLDFKAVSIGLILELSVPVSVVTQCVA